MRTPPCAFGLARAVSRLRADERGATTVVAALMVPLLIAGIGFGVETSLWYAKQRGLQHAADVAAHAAAIRKNSGADDVGMRAAAHHIAAQSGYAIDDSALFVHSPAISGPNAGDANTVEVTMRIFEGRLFSAILDEEPVTLNARAVAKIDQRSRACVLALDVSRSGAVKVGGSVDITLDGCDIAANSNASDAFDMFGSAALTTGCVHSVGGASATSALNLTECLAIHEHAAAVADPYRDIPEPAATGTCAKDKQGSQKGETVLDPVENHPSGVRAMRFCSGLSLKGDVVMKPGLYIVENGDVTVSPGANVTGAGVTIYLTKGARMKLTGNGALQLSAPSSGPYSGILFFGGRDQAGVEHTIAGTTDSTMQGAVYMPGSDIKFRGNSAVGNGCTQIIGNTVDFNGNSSLGASCTANGGRDIVARASVKIVE
ncbi:pilus assembly protein TadG-related protein [Fulvimarina sp. 2208YS6-2-32]|uniref:Pilus assembly protein TadG-related protein n=1 Tax=Fulvimarina uroteuthidis TaxID=3098149 RepID=A0ABU5I400_9HYPH|nr:pilus assembly protein TadG-related protein [Fulvimarina sp. 2208YS6-2-32]MDY8110117.1 pilus assembly protein TadG-related protein [Fulvimarina sp. 2208YS6-2-32]